MRRITFDLVALRSFVTGIELGGFAKAADRVGRSTSAVSAHLKKLEEQVGMPLLKKAGRGLVLTPAGERLLGYARRLLDLNDQAVASVREAELSGSVRIGLQEDFGEHLLSKMLGDFARAHPRVSVEAHVVRNAELLQLLNSGRVDLALAWDSGAAVPHGALLGKLPLCWIGPGAAEVADGSSNLPLPLVVFEAPCLMRSAATAALDAAGIPWRVALTSMSLNGIWAAVEAGLGVTVRTRAGMPRSLRVRDDLPKLPTIGLVLYQSDGTASAAVQKLSEIVREAVHGLISPRRARS
jgi:DNA-binding transcriptional LysR family regulator